MSFRRPNSSVLLLLFDKFITLTFQLTILISFQNVLDSYSFWLQSSSTLNQSISIFNSQLQLFISKFINHSQKSFRVLLIQMLTKSNLNCILGFSKVLLIRLMYFSIQFFTFYCFIYFLNFLSDHPSSFFFVNFSIIFSIISSHTQLSSRLQNNSQFSQAKFFAQISNLTVFNFVQQLFTHGYYDYTISNNSRNSTCFSFLLFRLNPGDFGGFWNSLKYYQIASIAIIIFFLMISNDEYTMTIKHVKYSFHFNQPLGETTLFFTQQIQIICK
ncbi:unnamed protein product (macronuclear) [Paramecium tetraurelia]|uniref:Transmembrane protein n=1 Tax=Paramecium tetraurelia TaxID=5888 RepID=A0CNU9_PARTE|nr:uncharacterized protein GSPATT00008908001 [Paramecium tetraurelia]CAK72466.1 unnamed protein product [Paramecium tetraurelia]|eukprot:XP_001439863.1 hypothetical protein (macronuclear) [Paramecium tetraurelia strain d4-2]